ncbi:MAG: histidinol-phosphate transaminase [Phycisphaeraceae bacterium]
MGYERDNIRQLHAYVPGEQPQTTDVVKLNTNENPYPPPPAVVEAVRAVTADQLRRYPPPRADRFREAAAHAHGLAPEQVIATHGGDELLRLAITVFCAPLRSDATPPRTGGLGIADPSYSLYPILAAIHDTPLRTIALDENFALPADFAERLNDAGCRLAMIVNPHAPSGRLEPIETLRAIAQKFNGVVLIDEAYVDFAERDALPLITNGEFDNVLLLRSMSKGYSLAGLRLGYGIGHPDLITALDKARDSYNLNIVAQTAAAAALAHRDTVRESWRKVVAERRRITDALAGMGWSILPSQSNFILATPPAAGPSARQLHESLKQQAIFVRYFDQERLDDRLRITIGTPEQNDALLNGIANCRLPIAD